MNTDGHKEKVKELEGSLNKLLPDPEGRHVVAVVEFTYGILLHIITINYYRYGNKTWKTFRHPCWPT